MARGSEFSQVFDVTTISTGLQRNVPMVNAPQNGPNGGLAYLKALRLYCAFVLDTDGTNAPTALTVHDLVQEFGIYTRGRYQAHGPVLLSGFEISAVRQLLTREHVQLLTASADAAIAISQTDALRYVLYEIPFWAMGAEPGDFSKAVRALAAGGGYVKIRFKAIALLTAQGFSGIDGTYYLEAVCVERTDYVVVPSMLIQKSSVEALRGTQIGYGTARLLALENAGAWVVGDVTQIDVKADGSPFVQQAIPDTYFQHQDPFVSGWSQNAFCDPIALTNGTSRVMPIYPSSREERRLTRMARGQLVGVIQGAETAGNLQWIAGLAQPVEVADIIEQGMAMGLAQNVITDALAAGNIRNRISGNGALPAQNVGEVPVQLLVG